MYKDCFLYKAVDCIMTTSEKVVILQVISVQMTEATWSYSYFSVYLSSYTGYFYTLLAVLHVTLPDSLVYKCVDMEIEVFIGTSSY